MVVSLRSSQISHPVGARADSSEPGIINPAINLSRTTLPYSEKIRVNCSYEEENYDRHEGLSGPARVATVVDEDLGDVRGTTAEIKRYNKLCLERSKTETKNPPENATANAGMQRLMAFKSVASAGTDSDIVVRRYREKMLLKNDSNFHLIFHF